MARFVQQDHYKVQSPTFFIGLKTVISREGKGRKKHAFCHLLTNKQNNKSMNCSTFSTRPTNNEQKFSCYACYPII
ncbi:hypothetical protein WN943_010958 [Citrus x changshan-huyou]